jgi:hypothetical protein
VLTNDLESYAPWMETKDNAGTIPEGDLHYPSFYAPSLAARPPIAKLVDPNSAWNEQIYAMVWGAMFFPTNWSQAWVHDARITLLASDQVDWPDTETYAFYDPATGMTYRAHHIGTEDVFGVPHEKGTGARMLEWANKLITLAYLVEVDANGDPLRNPDGTVVLKLDADGKAQKNDQNPGAIAVLQKYVDNIDTFRQLTATFEQPLTDWDLPQP